MKKKQLFTVLAILLGLTFMACENEGFELNNPKDQVLETRLDNCFNFRADLEGCLSFYHCIDTGGLAPLCGFGAPPFTGQLGPYTGEWSSVVVEIVQNDNQKGAAHYFLVHKFEIDENNYFYTEDRAICSPAVGLNATCLINNQLTIMGGAGIFANVSGKIKTHALLTLFDPVCLPDYIGSIDGTLHGRVCLN